MPGKQLIDTLRCPLSIGLELNERIRYDYNRKTL